MKSIINALLHIFKYLSVFALFSFVAVIICCWAFFALTPLPTDFNEQQIIALASLFFLLFCLIVLFFPLSFFLEPSSKRRLQSIRTLIVLILIGFVGFQLVDSKPFEDKYSRADLQPDGPDVGNSLFLFNALISGNIAPKANTYKDVFRDPDYLREVTLHEAEVLETWREKLGLIDLFSINLFLLKT